MYVYFLLESLISDIDTFAILSGLKYTFKIPNIEYMAVLNVEEFIIAPLSR